VPDGYEGAVDNGIKPLKASVPGLSPPVLFAQRPY
jgi:hypothetical protein